MNLRVSIRAKDLATESAWAQDLRDVMGARSGVDFECASQSDELGEVLFVDLNLPHVREYLDQLPHGERVVYLLIKETQGWNEVMAHPAVDDVVTFPVRKADLYFKLLSRERHRTWHAIAQVNQTVEAMTTSARDTLEFAERMQRARFPKRFDGIKGFQITNRYLAGLKSGGDYFDLADSSDGAQLSVLMSDSSSYGLSSAVLAALMEVAMKLTLDEVKNCRKTIQAVYDQVMATLKDRDHLSLFYGALSRKDLSFRYINLGSSCCFISPKGKGFQEVAAQGPALTRASRVPDVQETRIILNPSDRIVFASDGFVEAAGGREGFCSLLDRFRDQDPVKMVNELVYLVKSRFETPEDLPAQDCTAVVFDVDSRILRLQPTDDLGKRAG